MGVAPSPSRPTPPGELTCPPPRAAAWVMCEHTIETFDQDSTGHLGFNAYRMRSIEAMGKQWCVVFVAYALLHLTCLPAVPDRTQGLLQTLGDACRHQGRALLQKLLLFVHDQLSHGSKAEGATVQGSIETAEDRDVFTLHASSPKIRVILRKRFNAVVDVYDYVENLVNSVGQREDRTITFTFASTPGSIYYIVVKSSWEALRPAGERYHGDYQLTVRSE
jgi:hypothetical protein